MRIELNVKNKNVIADVKWVAEPYKETENPNIEDLIIDILDICIVKNSTNMQDKDLRKMLWTSQELLVKIEEEILKHK